MDKMHHGRIEVVAAIIEQDGRFFATQRGYGDHKGKWEFPGGKVEPGERREHALTREIEEELAVSIGIDRPVCTIECDYARFHLTMHCYLCHVVKGRLRLLEAQDARWLDREHLNDVDWLPADREVVRQLLDGR